MTVVDVLARIDEIHDRIRSFGLTRTDAAATPDASARATAGDFASAVQRVIGTGALAGGDVTGSDIVDQAMNYLGVPYVFAGEDETGMDCSGLVQRALADLGVDAPRTAREQMTMGTSVASLDEALPGDLVVFDGGSHIGIYVGDNRMIHAPRPGKVVQEADVYEKPTAIRRVLPQAAAAATSQSAVATALMSALTTVGATNGTPSTSVATSTEALTSSVASADVQRLALQMLTGSAA